MNRSYCIIVLFLILPPLNCHNGNMTDIFDIRDDCNMSKKYVATILFSLILLYGIVSNILLATVFCNCDNMIRYVWMLGLPIAMFAVYIVIFRTIRHRRKSSLMLCKASGYETKITDKYERLMLIQSAIVCGALEIEIICFYFLLQLAVKLAGKKVEIPVNIFINCYVIFNGALLPTVNFIFIKEFRKNVKRVIAELSSKFTNNKKAAIVPTILAT
ncbi:unnamed protein product [Cercopithifilaria johnstoni]|uniref:G-protein coupled receptors family 1 profile domain-containing protein n=1 Tax=Cercopithifilaria johnstoni TaxID=2874296 RepID=A0A8J2MLB2_9BILA|nr:unnamed protein product [Cercopithifilaria johnstoni]